MERVVSYYGIGVVITNSHDDAIEVLSGISDETYALFVKNLRLMQANFSLDSPGWKRIVNGDAKPIDLLEAEKGFLF